VQHTVYLFDGFQLDVTRRKLISSGGLVQPLNSRAMEALLLLVSNAGDLVEKRRLMQTVWPDSIVEDNNLNQCVLAIRKALGEAAGSNRYVMTVPGRGYRFVSPVHAVVRESGADAIVPAPHQQSRYASWIGIPAAICMLLLALMLWRVVDAPGPATTLARATNPSSENSAAIVLRLRDAPTIDVGSAGVNSTALLVQCLAARPGIKLQVRVQLVAMEDSPPWTGQYVAEARDLLDPQPVSNTSATACRDLMAMAQRDRVDVPAR
jgi:DNA-binding winged helix-turn-helix (wHTH) protein